jgi:hypothetical protein
MSTIHEVASSDTRPSGDRDIRYAQFHHNNFFTTRLTEMRDWYGTVLGMEVTFEFPMGAWLTNDRANHRIALTALPGLTDDPDKRLHARMHHHAFEYASFDGRRRGGGKVRARSREFAAEDGAVYAIVVTDAEGADVACGAFARKGKGHEQSDEAKGGDDDASAEDEPGDDDGAGDETESDDD